MNEIILHSIQSIEPHTDRLERMHIEPLIYLLDMWWLLEKPVEMRRRLSSLLPLLIFAAADLLAQTNLGRPERTKSSDWLECTCRR